MSNIPGRELIRAAFAHEGTERIPVFDVANNPAIFRKELGKENRWSDGIPTVRLSKKLGIDAAMVPVGSYTCLIREERDWVDPSMFRDRFGVSYTVSDTSWPLGIATGEVRMDREFANRFAQLADIRDIDIAPVRDAVQEAHRQTTEGGEIALFAGLRSGFSHLTISGGLVAVSMMIYEEPDLLKELVNLSTNYWTEVGLRLLEAGADALYVANDMGMNGSTMISPDHLREFFLPAFERQCAAWKAAGGTVILHSCGNIAAILPDLASMGESSGGQGGIDALNNLQEHAGMDIAAVKQQYGKKWTLIGNVDATTTMTSERKEDIDDAIKAVISKAGYDGGLILATDHSFHKGIPLDNVYHFIHRAKELGSAGTGDTV